SRSSSRSTSSGGPAPSSSPGSPRWGTRSCSCARRSPRPTGTPVPRPTPARSTARWPRCARPGHAARPAWATGPTRPRWPRVGRAYQCLRPAVASPVRDAGAAAAARAVHRPVAQVRAAWARRETRLGYWTHQSTMAPGVVISLVWGYPYLTDGLGYSAPRAASQLSLFVVANLAASFVVGPLAGRRPPWRTPMALSIATACVLAIAALVLWPGGRPPGAVVTIAFVVLATGGPGSQVGFHI